MQRIAKWLVIAFFVGTSLTIGPSAGSFTVTVSTLALLAAFAAIVLLRVQEDKPLVSSPVLRVSVLVACLVYFAIGVASGVFAEDKGMFVREVLQRMIIILLPIYVVVFGFKTPRDLLAMFVAYIPAGCLISGLAAIQGAKHLFREPVYLFSMHKNHVGAVAGITAMICVALLVSKQFPKLRIAIVGCFCVGMLGIVAAQNRASLVGLVLSTCLVFIAARVRRIYIILFAIAFVVGMFVLAVALPKEAIDSALTTRQFSSNWERQQTWSFLAEKLAQDPLVCVGWGNPIAVFGWLRVTDAASILFYDWIQMGLHGLIAQLVMVWLCIFVPLRNAKYLPRNSALMAINNSAMAIIAARFLCAYLDSFWIGRGASLTTFACVGAIIYVRLCIEHQRQTSVQARQAAARQPQPVAIASPTDSSIGGSQLAG